MAKQNDPSPTRVYGLKGARRRNIYITDDDWMALRRLGFGNASEGIREALRKAGAQKVG